MNNIVGTRDRTAPNIVGSFSGSPNLASLTLAFTNLVFSENEPSDLNPGFMKKKVGKRKISQPKKEKHKLVFILFFQQNFKLILVVDLKPMD